MGTWGTCSSAFDWMGLIVFTIRYYPQIYLSYQRKSVVGLDFTHVAWTALASLLDLVFYVALYLSEDVNAQYRDKFSRSELPAQEKDIVFAAHALITTAILVVQCFRYQRGKQSVPWICFIVCGMAVASVLGMFALQASCTGPDCYLVFFLYLASASWVLEVVRYIPQIWLNHARRHTDGFSLGFVLLSILGSVLELFAMIAKSGDDGDWQYVRSNIPTLCVLIITLLFDLVFVTQFKLMAGNPDPNTLNGDGALSYLPLTVGNDSSRMDIETGVYGGGLPPLKSSAASEAKESKLSLLSNSD